jgi:hypothetical protein
MRRRSINPEASHENRRHEQNHTTRPQSGFMFLIAFVEDKHAFARQLRSRHGLLIGCNGEHNENKPSKADGDANAKRDPSGKYAVLG